MLESTSELNEHEVLNSNSAEIHVYDTTMQSFPGAWECEAAAVELSNCDSSATSISRDSDSDIDTDFESDISSSSEFDTDTEDKILSDDSSFDQPRTANSEPLTKLTHDEEKDMALLSLLLRYHLGESGSRDVVKILNIFNPENKVKDPNRLKACIGSTETQVYEFCDKCYTLYTEEDIFQCAIAGCNGIRYKGPINKQQLKRKKTYFTCLPVKQQIKDILQREGIWSSIVKYRADCKATTDVTDIVTGEMYRDLCKPGQDNFTLLFKTDGVPLFKSSGVSIWPIYLVINELPPVLRFSRFIHTVMILICIKSEIQQDGEDYNEKLCDNFNDKASSLRLLDNFDFTEESKCTIYKDNNFLGRSLTFRHDVPNLKLYNLDDEMSSVVVKSGAWVGFTDCDYGGEQSLFLSGRYIMSDLPNDEGGFINDSLSSLRKIMGPSEDMKLLKIDYDSDKKQISRTPSTVFSWTQVNNTSVEQTLSETEEITIQRENTYEFRWDKGTKVPATMTANVGVPLVGKKEASISAEMSVSVGSAVGTKTTKDEKWVAKYPSKIPSYSTVTMTTKLTQGTINVPFTATLYYGGDKERTVTEMGMFYGCQHFDFHTEFNETKLSKPS